MNWLKNNYFNIIGFLLFFAFFIYFTNIIIFLIIAAIIGFAAQPIMKLLDKIHIPRSISAVISIIIFLLIFGGFLTILIPAIKSQTENLMQINFLNVSQKIVDWGGNVELKLKDVGVLSEKESIENIISSNLSNFVSKIQANIILGNLISITGNLFMGFFSILFMSFFFIKDNKLFQKIVLLFASEKNQENISSILSKIQATLTKYFIGILIEVSVMMILITTGGLIMGLKNALLIGFIGGFMNIIPYVGPIIGATIGATLITMTNIYLGVDVTLTLVGGILIVFSISNLIDNFVLQPIIYSNSVSAHPLEIFIMIFVGGTLGGPLGMILAIPIYTIIKIVAKEFLGDKKFIQRVTKGL